MMAPSESSHRKNIAWPSCEQFLSGQARLGLDGLNKLASRIKSIELGLMSIELPASCHNTSRQNLSHLNYHPASCMTLAAASPKPDSNKSGSLRSSLIMSFAVSMHFVRSVLLHTGASPWVFSRLVKIVSHLYADVNPPAGIGVKLKA